MKIVHVSNFPIKPKGPYAHSAAPKITNGLIRNGHFVSNFPDRDVARASSLLHNRKWGVGPANKVLRRYCTSLRPDLLLLGHADVIRPDTIAEIRHDIPHMRVLQWNVDPLFEDDNIRRISGKLEVVDATLVTTAGEDLRVLARPGKRLGFMPNPVDFSVESGHNHEFRELPFDFFYAAGGPVIPRKICGEWITIGDLLDRLRTSLPDLRARYAGLAGQPYLMGHAYQEALESAAIGLNISRRDDVLLYSSDRLAHMIGNGLAVLIGRQTGYDRLFTDEQMGFFDSVGGMIAKLRFLANEPEARMQLGAAGRARYHALFNEQVIAKYIVDVALDQHDPKDYEWPTVLT